MSNQRGFSLIETMVVLVLVGIILGVVTPSFGRYRLTLVSERTRGQLIEDIRAARQRAITQHAPVIVAFGNGVGTTNITTYTVHFDANGDKLAQLSELKFSRTVPRDSKLSQVSLQPPDTLIFDVSGTLKTGTHGGTIAVNTADANDTLAVSVAGLVYRQ